MAYPKSPYEKAYDLAKPKIEEMIKLVGVKPTDKNIKGVWERGVFPLLLLLAEVSQDDF